MTFAIDGFYPVIIHESRYNGAYEGGPWWLTAGNADPTGTTDIAGSDTDCMDFWDHVHGVNPRGVHAREDGWPPDLPSGRVIDNPHDTEFSNDRIIVVAGESPQSCFEYARFLATHEPNDVYGETDR